MNRRGSFSLLRVTDNPRKEIEMGQCHTTAKVHREKKRNEAQERQENFKARTDAQQLELIRQRRGESRRERHRMLEIAMEDR